MRRPPFRRTPAASVVTRIDDPDSIGRIPLAALLIANLVPLGGVVLFGWDARYLLLLYWMENLVVGGYTLIRMLHIGGFKGVFKAAFFTFHYSFFCAGHGMFIIMLTAIAGEDTLEDADDGLPFMLPFNMLSGQIEWISREMPGVLGLPLLAFIVSHGISTVVHHFMAGEDARRDADDIMFDPYKRILALHVAIILGAIAMIGTDTSKAVPALIILVAIKTVIDIHQHRKAHRQRREESRRPPEVDKPIAG